MREAYREAAIACAVVSANRPTRIYFVIDFIWPW